jgi:hypothetical protein
LNSVEMGWTTRARSIKEILPGHGLTKPWFTSETSKPSPVNMADTVLVWTLLLDLYLTYSSLCVECDGEL